MCSACVKKLHLSFKKTGLIPGKAPSEAVQKDLIQQIEHHSQQKGTVLLFFDPCHLLHNVVNARMWQPRGKNGTMTIKSNIVYFQTIFPKCVIGRTYLFSSLLGVIMVSN